MIDCTKHLVLLVDSEIAPLELLSEYFLDEGFDVLSASCVQGACAILDTRPVNLIVSAAVLKDGSGLDILEHSKFLNENRPLYLYSSAREKVSVEEVYDRGAEAIFFKPINYEALIETSKKELVPRNEAWPRASTRLFVDLKIELRIKGQKSSFHAQALNIAQGGLFASFENQLPNINETVNFRLKIEGVPFSTIEGKGVTRWVSEESSANSSRGIGIEFKELSQESRKGLFELINAIKSRAFIPISR